MTRKFGIAAAIPFVLSAALMSTSAHALLADGITYTLTEFSTSDPHVAQFNLDITGINAVGTDTEGGRSGIHAIAFNLPGGFQNAVMITPPSGFVLQPGGINASGCSLSGNFFCFDNTAILNDNPTLPGSDYPAGTSLQFVFQVTLDPGNTFAGYTNPDFKIDWVGTKNNYDLVSQGISIQTGPCVDCDPQQVPEPRSATLLGVGLAVLGFGWLVRRVREDEQHEGIGGWYLDEIERLGA